MPAKIHKNSNLHHSGFSGSHRVNCGSRDLPSDIVSTDHVEDKNYLSQPYHQGQTLTLTDCAKYVLTTSLFSHLAVIADPAAGTSAETTEAATAAVDVSAFTAVPEVVISPAVSGQVIIDLDQVTVLADAVLAAYLAVPKPSSHAYPDVLTTANRLGVPKFRVVNKSCRNVQLDAGVNTTASFEGVHRKAGLAPRQSAEFVYNPYLRQWQSVGSSSQ